MNVVCVTGGTGFLGRHLIDRLRLRRDTEIRVLTRDSNRLPFRDRVVAVRGDIRDPNALAELMSSGGDVVHLVYSSSISPRENVGAAGLLAGAACSSRVRRFIHVSTAVVVGRTDDEIITEHSQCRPANEYERTKLEIEDQVQEHLARRIDYAVLRPTAVFGAGGENLVSLALELTQRRRVRLRLRAMLMGTRRMNLVYVENVVEAICHLLDLRAPLGGERFIVSDDDASDNDFRSVVSHLASELDVRPPRFAPDVSWLLPVALRMRRRPLANPRTQFSSHKLRATGYVAPVTFREGIHRFAQWFRERKIGQGH
jgi:nucleoside-diphosphate-sugar epimerase